MKEWIREYAWVIWLNVMLAINGLGVTDWMYWLIILPTMCLELWSTHPLRYPSRGKQ